jgi:hypothetical protein
MSDELKPCPFCGEPLRVYQINNLPNAVWCVECTGENCYWENEVGGDTRAEAEAVANAPRPVEDALRAKVAYLESALADAENDTYRALSAFNELDAKLDAVPWEGIRWAAYQAGLFVEWTLDIKSVLDWCDANAPKEEEQQP